MPIYSIKYIETKGLEEFDGRLTPDGTYASTPRMERFERLGTDAFLTREAAAIAGYSKLRKKLRDLDTQTEKKRKRLEARMAQIRELVPEAAK